MTKITGETGETRRDGDGGSGLHAAAEKTQHPAASGALPIYVDKRIQEELELLGVRGGKEVKEGALDEKVDKMDEMGGKGKINGEMMFWEKTRKRGCGEGGKDMDDEHENENENKDKDEGIVMGKGKGLMGWINWDKWGISFVLGMFLSSFSPEVFSTPFLSYPNPSTSYSFCPQRTSLYIHNSHYH